MTSVVDWLDAQLSAEEDDLRRTYDPTVSDTAQAERLAILRGHRAILDRHAVCGSGTGRCDDGGHGWEEECARGAPGCADLQTLADMYRWRPGYNSAWAY